MKVLVFVDYHDQKEYYKSLSKKAEYADLILGAGDYSMFGNNLRKIMKDFDNFGKPCLFIHGNHESEEEMIESTKGLKNIKWIHKEIVKKGDYKILAYGGGGFERRNEEFEAFVKKEKVDDKTILLVHGPPYETIQDTVYPGMHSGNISYKEFIREKQPGLVICGHIHETAGLSQTIGKTIILNPGPEGVLLDL